MNQEKIGRFIANCRKSKNMTQQELADKLGVTDRAISNWENGRRLPDYTLLKDLCYELGITINDLLSGERIKNEQEEAKFEENILNTLDYSNNKIKHIKNISILIISVIVIALTILFTLFGIDVYRMRNNKPVFFSTWGFKYSPPININEVDMERAIKDYLIKEDEKNNHYDNEKSFVAMRTYLINEDSEGHYYLYAWVVQEKYYEENGNVIEASSSSIPYKFEIVKEDEYTVEDYTIPRDGSYYVKDMKHIFPNSVLKDMDTISRDGTIENLSQEIKSQVSLYFHQK